MQLTVTNEPMGIRFCIFLSNSSIQFSSDYLQPTILPPRAYPRSRLCVPRQLPSNGTAWYSEIKWHLQVNHCLFTFFFALTHRAPLESIMGQGPSSSLFNTHVTAAVLHGVQAAAVAAVFATSQQDRGFFTLSQRVYGQEKWSVKSRYIPWLVVAFPTLSMTSHIASAISLAGGSRELVAEESNPVRWVEYSISAGVMLWIIAQLSGIQDVPLLFTIVMMNISLQLCGYYIEATGDDTLAFTLLGWIAFVSIWIPIMWKFIDTVTRPGSEAPDIVFAIVFLEFVLFASFGVASVYFRQKRTAVNVASREKTYIALSLVAKSLLTWMVVGGALNAGQ